MNTPVVFLDIDGVLNHGGDYEAYHRAFADGGDAYSSVMGPVTDAGERHVGKLFNASCVAVLNDITDATCADIVISSSWRMSYADRFDVLRAHLVNAGVRAKVLGLTPPTVPWRGEAIIAWLHNSMRASVPMVILDDEPRDAFGECATWSLETDPLTGLRRDRDLNNALRIIRGEPWRP